MNSFSSKAYWEQRYSENGNSGAGSYGRLASYKADILNAFIAFNRISSILELGCGDGNQLSLMTPVASYIGVDVSETTINNCRKKFPSGNYTFLKSGTIDKNTYADLVLSLDVIFHLVEDDIFKKYMNDLFHHSKKYVIIYSSNVDAEWPATHVRHRNITKFAREHIIGWTLKAYLPNKYPFDKSDQNNTSFSDFMIFSREDEPVFLSAV
ncbi:class I SAM-dependent methyltransferase [Gluconacetobacter liquefaciens]|uniref:Class I SAM-dependent methyltransferase n=1 Tax=Gluconacetobacter liquefaciens TaxID=89584 RepID=A0A370GCR7_GLULI|nr:class I SAM-dependent methyltransferase [Gluconacetobacter liquefaciens]MBB2185957.1 class I SAM-dependent methyltransferase [Gluconacetobacter liquefaciens]RDI39773.1 methyltransferase family protein [Gluconacetobacter liquefaciens]